MTARLAAARALLLVERGDATLGAALDDSSKGLSDPRDRALALELTTGTLRWRAELDALLAGAAQRSVRTIPPPELAVLRLGAYQLRHLDRIPAHAIVSEAVDGIRELGAPRAAGFVNAVLRSMIRRGPALALPKRPTDPGPSQRERQLAYLSTTMSHPRWLVERWLDRLGFEATERWCQFNNASPSMTVRAIGHVSRDELLRQLRAAGVAAEPAPYVADAVRLAAGALGDVPDDVRQQIWIQDEGAQLVARMANARAGERVLDTCAAPGGKSLVLSKDMGGSGLLVAADYRPGRVALLRDVMTTAGVTAPIVQLDARLPLPFDAIFDVVVLDAPCSGLGTLRRDPDLKWSRTATDLPGLATSQQQMLQSAATAVRPGGRLVYATCSSEPEENAAVVDAFLASRTGFRETCAPASIAAELVDARGHLVTRPDRHGLEAFFAAVLVRADAA